MTEITANVQVTEICEFARVNNHFEDRYGDPVVEKFLAISMRTADGRMLRNFTKFNREFPSQVATGDSFTLTYRVKEENRVCPESGERYTAVVYCKRGVSKALQAEAKREARKLKRLQKLGLA